MDADWFSVAQISGYCAAIISVSANIRTNDERLARTAAIGAFVWCLHYMLLMVPTASLMFLLIGLRQACSPWLKRGGQRWRNLAAAGFASASVVLAMATWGGVLSAVALAANLVAIAGYLYLNGVRLRLLLAVALAMWLAIAILTGSIGGVVSSSVGLAFAITSAWRLRRARQFHTDAC